jgi:hypothetical protein
VGAGRSINGWGLVAERAVSSAVVVVPFPVTDHDSGLGQRPEDVDVEAFVADSAVERFDVAVAPRFSGRDEGQPDPFAGPVGHRVAGQFRAVVAAQHGRVATHGGEAVQFVDEDVGGDGSFDEPAAVEVPRRLRRRRWGTGMTPSD